MGFEQTVMNEFLNRLVALTDTLSDNQVAIVKQNQKLQARVESLETRCTLQDAEIALLDAGCGSLWDVES